MAIFGLLAILIETTWLANWPMDSLHLDLVIVAVAAVSFSFEWRQALPIIVFYGLLMDMTSSGPWGMSIFSYVIIYGFVRAVISKISFQTGPALLFWVFVVSFLDKILCVIVLMAATGELAIPRIIMRDALPQAVLDAVVGLMLVPFLNWYSALTWEKITRPKGIVLK